MATTIQVDVNLVNELRKRKVFDRESYADVIRDLLESSERLNDETRRDVETARREIKEGRYYSLDEVRKQLRR